MPSRDGSTAEYRSAGCSSCGVCCSWALWLCSAGTSRALRHEIDAGGDEDKQDQRGVEPAEVQAAGGQGLVEQVAERCAERTRQNEREPEEQSVRNAGPEVQSGCDGQARAEDQRPDLVAQLEAAAIGTCHPVAERSAERLREEDRHPVEPLDLRLGDALDRDRALAPVPDRKACCEQGGDDDHAAGVAEANRSVGEVGQGRRVVPSMCTRSAAPRPPTWPPLRASCPPASSGRRAPACVWLRPSPPCIGPPINVVIEERTTVLSVVMASVILNKLARRMHIQKSGAASTPSTMRFAWPSDVCLRAATGPFD